MSKKKNRFSKFIVTLVIIMNIIFTAAVLYVFVKVGNEPMALLVHGSLSQQVNYGCFQVLRKSKVKEERKW